MIPILSDDQRQAIDERNGGPVDVVDTSKNVKYVIVRKEVFEKMKAMAGEAEADEFYPLLAQISPEDWEDASHYGIQKP